jgi:hypothetical protein
VQHFAVYVTADRIKERVGPQVGLRDINTPCKTALFHLLLELLRACCVYGVIQEENSIFWEVIVSVFVRKKVLMNMCIIVIACRKRALWICKYRSIVSCVSREREKLLCVNFILISIWCLNDKFVTGQYKFSNIPPSTSVYFATRVRRSRVFSLSWSSKFFHAGSRI